MDAKFACFGWHPFMVDGHDAEAVRTVLQEATQVRSGRPKVVIADTVKGKGVPKLEGDSLCHIRALKAEEIDALVGEFAL